MASSDKQLETAGQAILELWLRGAFRVADGDVHPVINAMKQLEGALWDRREAEQSATRKYS